MRKWIGEATLDDFYLPNQKFKVIIGKAMTLDFRKAKDLSLRNWEIWQRNNEVCRLRWRVRISVDGQAWISYFVQFLQVGSQV